MSRIQPKPYPALENELKAIVGNRYVLSSPIDLALYECDGDTLDIAIPDLVVLPKTTDEVQQVVRLAGKHKVPVTARGAGTGLSGGATTIMGGISLVLTRMTGILAVRPSDLMAHVEAGVTNAAVSQAAAQYGLYFAPDPSSQAASTIGGNVAENAGGAHTLKYGLTVNNVLGVKVVLPDGEVVILGGTERESLGLDLLGVFVGSEGTLGIATEAYLKLVTRAQSTETMLSYFPSVAAGGQAVSEIVARGVIPAAMEMIDSLTLKCVDDALHLGLNRNAAALLIVELDGPPAAISIERTAVEESVNNNKCIEIKWAANEKERQLIWKARKSAFSSLGRLAPHGYVLDGVIPRSKLAQAITEIESIGQKHSLLISNVYHAGDGNLHPCLMYNRDDQGQVERVLLAAREILEMCVHLGGTLSGEHGIGIEKIREMSVVFAPEELAIMSDLRRSFDPAQLLNPGKLIPTPKSCGESGSRPLLRHQLSAC